MSNTPLKTIQEVKANSFVFEKANALEKSFCDEIITRFEQDEEGQYKGRIGQLADKDDSIKKSTDLVVSGKDHWKDIDKALFQSLGKAILEFRETYPFFKGPFKDMGYGVQRTQAGEHYHWHIDGGSHDIKIKPETGKLLLFPPFWTHEHRGVTLETGVKYIATTWVVFA